MRANVVSYFAAMLSKRKIYGNAFKSVGGGMFAAFMAQPGRALVSHVLSVDDLGWNNEPLHPVFRSAGGVRLTLPFTRAPNAPARYGLTSACEEAERALEAARANATRSREERIAERAATRAADAASAEAATVAAAAAEAPAELDASGDADESTPISVDMAPLDPRDGLPRGPRVTLRINTISARMLNFMGSDCQDEFSSSDGDDDDDAAAKETDAVKKSGDAQATPSSGEVMIGANKQVSNSSAGDDGDKESADASLSLNASASGASLPSSAAQSFNVGGGELLAEGPARLRDNALSRIYAPLLATPAMPLTITIKKRLGSGVIPRGTETGHAAIREPRLLPGPPYHVSAPSLQVRAGELEVPVRELAAEGQLYDAIARQLARRRAALAAGKNAGAASAVANDEEDGEDGAARVKRARPAAGAADGAAAAEEEEDVSLSDAVLAFPDFVSHTLPGLERNVERARAQWAELPSPVIPPPEADPYAGLSFEEMRAAVAAEVSGTAPPLRVSGKNSAKIAEAAASVASSVAEAGSEAAAEEAADDVKPAKTPASKASKASKAAQAAKAAQEAKKAAAAKEAAAANDAAQADALEKAGAAGAAMTDESSDAALPPKAQAAQAAKPRKLGGAAAASAARRAAAEAAAANAAADAEAVSADAAAEDNVAPAADAAAAVPVAEAENGATSAEADSVAPRTNARTRRSGVDTSPAPATAAPTSAESAEAETEAEAFTPAAPAAAASNKSTKKSTPAKTPGKGKVDKAGAAQATATEAVAETAAPAGKAEAEADADAASTFDASGRRRSVRGQDRN